MRIAPLALLALAACHSTTPPPTTSGEHAVIVPGATGLPTPDGRAASAPASVCNATPVQDIIGKPRTDALAEDARLRANAKVVRSLTPDDVVTMEFREDRLDLHLDAAGRIASARCG